MTGPAFIKGKAFMDFDNYKNQEWLRRRKLRLEQVRKQSNEIAKVLRQKVNEAERKRLEEYERAREEKFQLWKAERLEELERKFISAFEGFGSSYRLAEEEPDQKLIQKEQYQINLSRAQKRGEIAQQEDLKRKRLAKEKFTAAIERKKMIRKKEDLRSALVRTIPLKKQLIKVQEDFEEESQQPVKQKITMMKKKVKNLIEKQSAPINEKKVPGKSMKKKKANHRSCGCKSKATELETRSAKKSDTVWINLDEMQTSSTGDSGPHFRSSKSTLDSKRSEKERREGPVEFYDFSSRFLCRSFKEYPHLVERIDPNSEELNARELARIEEEEERVEAKKKAEVDAVSQGRGLEALRKEKINKDYNDLMIKLEELSKKEKILKAQTRNSPSFLHMNDERLSERTKARQRMMESKFESVFYGAIAGIPSAGVSPPEPLHNLSGGGDYVDPDDLTGRLGARLSFSASNLKYNSPATSAQSSSRSSSGAPTLEPFQQESKDGTGKSSQTQLLKSISRALREGRELRKTINEKWSTKSSEEEGKKEEGEEEEEEDVNDDDDDDDENEEKEEEVRVFPKEIGSEKTLKKCQESQTEEVGGIREREETFDKGGDDSLPASTSTSYKSPPSVIRCHRLNQFLDYLEGLSENEENRLMQHDPKIRRKVNGMLEKYLVEKEEEQKEEKSQAAPTLEYYVEKLLNMSRECIANLSVSSENISTPNITDLDLDLQSECPSRTPSRAEDLIRKSRMERADVLQKSIKDWKTILQKYLPENKSAIEERSEAEDVVDNPQVEVAKEKSKDPFALVSSREVESRYDLITKKCSERISELSDMLNKVRKDKEKLLGSASGGSSGSLSKGDRCSEKGLDVEEEKVVPVRRRCPPTPKTPPMLEGFINRYNLIRPREETVSTTAIADSQSQTQDDSLESWPDVMDELLKREILTSPFKWSEGDVSSELTVLEDSRTKPSSIESVIGNFRKEIDRINPFAGEKAFRRTSSDVAEKPRWTTDNECQELLSSPRRRGEGALREESSVESIDHYLTSLGLNWAKSFLRKDAESRARSSSSNSERRSSGDEEDNRLLPSSRM